MIYLSYILIVLGIISLIVSSFRDIKSVELFSIASFIGAIAVKYVFVS